ncbi:uncharacterized protein LOC134185471 [Corticium candelabrum]|uniref:uncharacterized protein LOC134185471 n=1 Tax=Corticium candelabrum TaxID=121492 RepID=UPI002E258A5E|nr:uncharacterized protein LOC134185471 [Corticium candelabrum]
MKGLFLINQYSTHRQHPRGSNSGPSGWRFEHLRLLMDNAGTAEDIYFAATGIAEGKLSKSACKLSSSARLVALSKSSVNMRPGAIGKVLRCVTAKTICCQLKQSLSKFFAPIQYGVATDGGSELVVNHILLLQESNKHWSLLKTCHVKNAFDSITRSYLMQMIHKYFPEIYNHVFQMFSDSNPLSLQMLKKIALVIICSSMCLCPGQVLTDFASNTERLQHKLNDKQTKFQVQYMIDNSSIKDATRLRFLQGKGSGAWLDAIPTSRKLAISSGLLHLATFMTLSLRLGLRLPLPQSVIECDCGKHGEPMHTTSLHARQDFGHTTQWSLLGPNV